VSLGSLRDLGKSFRSQLFRTLANHALRYLYPSNSANGTIISPSPSYIEVPVNTGHTIGAGKSSIAAIVVALAFAHFA
jgi:hypothetical protein